MILCPSSKAKACGMLIACCLRHFFVVILDVDLIRSHCCANDYMFYLEASIHPCKTCWIITCRTHSIKIRKKCVLLLIVYGENPPYTNKMKLRLLLFSKVSGNVNMIMKSMDVLCY